MFLIVNRVPQRSSAAGTDWGMRKLYALFSSLSNIQSCIVGNCAYEVMNFSTMF